MVKAEFRGSSESSSSKFGRQGTSEKEGAFDLPIRLSSLIDRNADSLSLESGDAHNRFLLGLLSSNPEYLPDAGPVRDLLHKGYLEGAYKDSLERIATTDPFSGNYERLTEAAYTNRLLRTLANIDSQMVRGGAEHGALMKGQAIADANALRGEEIAKNRAIDADLALRGATVLSELDKAAGASVLDAYRALLAGRGLNVESMLKAGDQRTMRGGAHTAALLGAAKGRGKFKEKIKDDLAGWGQQSSNSFGWGTGFDLCCWQFISSLDADFGLPYYVNMGKAEFRSGPRKWGYKLMSKFTVPLMERKPWVRKLVRWLMVNPIMRFGEWFYEVDGIPAPGRKHGFIYAPVFAFWLLTWTFLGWTFYAYRHFKRNNSGNS